MKNGVYTHPERKALFIGDYINRGPANFEVVDIVRKMVEADKAYALMGNHEYNAVAYHKRHPETGEPLRPHNKKNIDRHKTFLDEMERGPQKAHDALNWFMTLPMALKIDHGHFVHACWEHDLITKTKELVGPEMKMTEEFLIESVVKQSTPWEIIETVLKGPEIELDHYGVNRYDEEGKLWNTVRIAWWPTKSKALDKVILNARRLPECSHINLDDRDLVNSNVSPEHVCFFGHYWMTGEPELMTSNIACVDYSIARGEKLVCYRWDGETQLSNDKFVYVT